MGHIPWQEGTAVSPSKARDCTRVSHVDERVRLLPAADTTDGVCDIGARNVYSEGETPIFTHNTPYIAPTTIQ